MAESSIASERESDSKPPASSTAGTPRVAKFAFADFTVLRGKWSARCKHCKKTLTDKEGTTTAFTK